MRPMLLAAALLPVFAAPPAFADATGPAMVLGGDVVEISGQRFRLFGIDAPEFHQICYIDGKPWTCGAAAVRALQTMLELERVTCKDSGESAGTLGAYAVCTIGERDIADELIRQGMAVAVPAQSDQYVAAETAAKEKGVGVWRSRFVPPWDWRADMTAIETRLETRVRTAVRDRADEALMAGDTAVAPFAGFRIARGSGGEARQTSIDEFKDGFILGSIQSEVFNWQEPAKAFAEWQQTAVRMVRSDAVGYVRTGLTALPRREVEADGPAFIAAIRTEAAPLIAAGRQPVLLVRGREDPPQIKEWFGGEVPPPADIAITRKDGIAAEAYLGTVEGVDVYLGDLPEQEALLFGADILETITYGADADGRVVTIAEQAGAGDEPPKMLFQYAQALTWKNEPVVVLKYKYKPEPVGYMGGG